jgi:hypothetical protein
LDQRIAAHGVNTGLPDGQSVGSQLFRGSSHGSILVAGYRERNR